MVHTTEFMCMKSGVWIQFEYVMTVADVGIRTAIHRSTTGCGSTFVCGEFVHKDSMKNPDRSRGLVQQNRLSNEVLLHRFFRILYSIQ